MSVNWETERQIDKDNIINLKFTSLNLFLFNGN